MKRGREEESDAVQVVPKLRCLQVLGRGGFGFVQKAVWGEKDMTVAVKTSSRGVHQYYLAETQALQRLKHPFIVSMYTTFSTTRYNHVVLEYCKGGDLFTVLTQQPELVKHALFYVVELVCVMEFLHSQGVAYCDAKLENVGLGDDGHVRLFDFGLACQGVTEPHCGISAYQGSELYMAPEMFDLQSYGLAVDVWALACVIVELYTLCHPVRHATKSPADFLPDDLDPVVRDLLQQMFLNDPCERITMKGVKQHKLFHDIDWQDVENKTWQVPPFVPSKDVYSPEVDGFMIRPLH